VGQSRSFGYLSLHVRFASDRDQIAVGDLLEMHRHVEAQRLGGLEVDGKIEFGRILDWQIGWALTFPAATAAQCRTSLPAALNK
jgi:hypothetical protein